MIFRIILVFLIQFVLLSVSAPAKNEISQMDAEMYLNQFGYADLAPLAQGANADFSKSIEQERKVQTQNALKDFQKFARLPVTGKLDKATKEKMLAPRCGLPDIERRQGPLADLVTRDKWPGSTVTWTIKQYSSKMSESEVRRAMQQAFKTWSQVMQLDFIEASPQAKTDMQIKFEKRKHDDPYPFDGTGKTLAHAFYPRDGRLHFDEEELWTAGDQRKIEVNEYVDFFSVAVHELGHSLGLEHTNTEGSIMLPYYLPPREQGSVLGAEDIRRIQGLYGKRGDKTDKLSPKPTETPLKPTKPEPTVKPTPSKPVVKGSCPKDIDAATTATNGNTYVFYGSNVYIFTPQFDKPTISPIDQVFEKFRGPVSAAVTSKISQLVVLFQDKKVFAYEWINRDEKFVLHPDFPKTLPSEIPAPSSAFQLDHGNTLIAKGDDFYMYDEYWNKSTFSNKLSRYYASFPKNAKTIFNIGGVVVKTSDDNKYTKLDGQLLKPTSSVSLEQLLKCR